MRRTLTVALFALALIAGPVAAACGSCCPGSASDAAFAPAQGCCGDCEPTVDRSPDPASLTAKSVAAAPDDDAVLLASTPAPPSLVRASRVAEVGANVLVPPRVSLSPLRL